MSTISEIKQRANALANKTDVNSITPKEVGDIMYDLGSYGEHTMRNGGTLGVRKVYESVAAMEADSISPVDLWGNPIKKGNLVVIYDGTTTGVDNNKIYAFLNPGWKLATELDAGYAMRAETEAKLTELASKFGINYVSPKSQTENLVVKDTLFLNLSKAIGNNIFEYDEKTINGFVMTRLIEVESGIEYTIGNVSMIYEWDSNCQLVNTLLFSSDTYGTYVFTTTENTKYISVRLYLSDGRQSRFKSLQKGSHEVLLNPKTLDMKTYLGAEAKFAINEEAENLIKERTTYYKDVELTVDEEIKGKYYNFKGNLTENSSFTLRYYAVNEGDVIHLYGKYRGTITAFVLLEEKDGTPIESYGVSATVNDLYNIDEYVTIKSGVHWIGLSSASNATTKPYNTTAIDKPFQYLEEKIEQSEAKGHLFGKTILAIGDSITASKYWQDRVGEILGMNVRTHAKGGIGIIQMVDGDGSGDAPEGYDPDNFGVSTIYRLNDVDVAGVSIIVLMGFYNTRVMAKNNLGELTDIYPTQDTWYGQMNYAISRVYEELDKAGNTTCKVVICSAHKYGKYPYRDVSAYEDGHYLLDATRNIAERHSLFFIDLMSNGQINQFNWNKFQSSSTIYNKNYIPYDGVNDATNSPFPSLSDAPNASENNGKYITIQGVSGCYKSNGSSWVAETSIPAVWNGDQLHLNKNGGDRLGDYIARQLITI